MLLIGIFPSVKFGGWITILPMLPLVKRSLELGLRFKTRCKTNEAISFPFVEVMGPCTFKLAAIADLDTEIYYRTPGLQEDIPTITASKPPAPLSAQRNIGPARRPSHYFFGPRWLFRYGDYTNLPRCAILSSLSSSPCYVGSEPTRKA